MYLHKKEHKIDYNNKKIILKGDYKHEYEK